MVLLWFGVMLLGLGAGFAGLVGFRLVIFAGLWFWCLVGSRIWLMSWLFARLFVSALDFVCLIAFALIAVI